MLTKARGMLAMSRDKWSGTQKDRARDLFKECPRLKEAYDTIDSLRRVFRNKTVGRDEAKTKLHEWYDTVTKCTLREMKSVRDTIKFYEDEILNYFIDRSTNASAESLNSKMKAFRASLRGVRDMSFFMFRLVTVFG